MDEPNQPESAPSSDVVPEASPAPDPVPALHAKQAPAELLAPGVPRLGTPRGAARRVIDPSANHPSYLFLAVVAVVTLASDIGTKVWAEHRLEAPPAFPAFWSTHLTFTLAKNRGGAWGLLQTANENVRRPFFLLVSIAAIAFIVTLYRRLQPRQTSLKWGLPLVLGGALGNVFDRIRYGWVIDFIDYRAEWVRKMNDVVGRAFPGHGTPTDHWPTFNVADVAICVGVALMAIDMFSSKRGRPHHPITGVTLPPPPPPSPSQGDVNLHTHDAASTESKV